MNVQVRGVQDAEYAYTITADGSFRPNIRFDVGYVANYSHVGFNCDSPIFHAWIAARTCHCFASDTEQGGVTASMGSVYLRTFDGTAYIKSTATGNTGGRNLLPDLELTIARLLPGSR